MGDNEKEIGYTAARLGIRMATLSPSRPEVIATLAGDLAVVFENLAEDNEIMWGIDHDYEKALGIMISIYAAEEGRISDFYAVARKGLVGSEIMDPTLRVDFI